jgi:hypothetical protein
MERKLRGVTAGRTLFAQRIDLTSVWRWMKMNRAHPVVQLSKTRGDHGLFFSHRNGWLFSGVAVSWDPSLVGGDL